MPYIEFCKTFDRDRQFVPHSHICTEMYVTEAKQNNTYPDVLKKKKRNQGDSPLTWDDAQNPLEWHTLSSLGITVSF